MLKASTASLVVAATTSTAFAADLPSRAVTPVFVPPGAAFSWTGFYVGGNVGYTETSGNNVSLAPTGGAALGSVLAGGAPIPGFNAFGGLPGSVSDRRSGFIGGGQVGYNYQFSGAVVGGIEADIQGLSNSGSGTSFTSGPGVAVGLGIPPVFQSQSNVTRRIDYIGTVRGRLGYSFGRVLVYGTGGLAYGETELGYNTTFPVVPALTGGAATLGGSNSASRMNVGWTAGGGGEYAITDHWSVKAEALYYDLGRQSVTTIVRYAIAPGIPVPPAVAARTGTVTASVRNDAYIARAGLNYRFGFDPVPVVARY